MKPIFVPHASYQSFVIDQLQQHYSGGILVLIQADKIHQAYYLWHALF
jgi:hypothetical protein